MSKVRIKKVMNILLQIYHTDSKYSRTRKDQILWMFDVQIKEVKGLY